MVKADFLGRAPVAGKNIVTDYGAVGDGVTNCTTAFTNFRTFARTQNPNLVLLYIPPGTYLIHDTANVFGGISNLIISGYGATITFPDSFRITDTAGFRQVANKSARLHTVSTGDTAATLITAGDAANFSVGRWCAIAALEWQGINGFPPNHHYIQYVQITGIAAGVISFFPAAIQSYLDTFPETSTYPTPPFVYDPGGPATLFLMDGNLSAPATAWDTQIEVYGVTFTNTGGSGGAQINGPGRRVEYIDCAFVACGPTPSQNILFRATRCTTDTVQIEVDKECERVEFIDCDLFALTVQSSSIQYLLIDGTTVTDHNNGTARRQLIKGASDLVNVQVSPAGYGATEELIIESPAVIHTLTANNANRQTYGSFTQSGGDLTYTGAVGTPLPWGVPGTLAALGTSTRVSGYGSVISAVTAASREAVLHTTFASPLPTLPALWGSPSYVFQQPALAVSVEVGVTGCPQVIGLTGGTQGLPLFSSLDYTDTWMGTPPLFNIRGQLISLLVDVVTPYTGAQATANLHIGGAGNNQPIRDASGNAAVYGPIINTKVAGQRLITPTTVTGAQSGDTLGAAPGLIWFIDFGGFQPLTVGSFGGDSAPQLCHVRIYLLLNQAP
jgi:hypothetical protein